MDYWENNKGLYGGKKLNAVNDMEIKKSKSNELI